MPESVLHIEGLTVEYRTATANFVAVNRVSLEVKRGETVALVGESGSGKTTAAMAVIRMTEPPAYVTGGRVLLESQDLMQLDGDDLRQLRGAKLALIPQGAMNSLNPVLRIEHQIGDTIDAHSAGVPEREKKERVRKVLTEVGLPPDVARLFPHQLSGGMKQRVCIAMAAALSPTVIIADEPTSALDVVVQRRVMHTLKSLQERLDAALILVGHDMALMSLYADRVAVMYAGKLVEVGGNPSIFKTPRHPYTKLLVESLPSLSARGEFRGIAGVPPSLSNLPTGCLFHPRCPSAMPECSSIVPAWTTVSPDCGVACLLQEKSR